MAHEVAGGGVILLGEGVFQLLVKRGLGLGDFVLQILQGGAVLFGLGLGEGFAPLHLLHQKFGVDLGVVGVVGVDVVLLQKVGGAVDGGFERGVGLVEGGAHHQGLLLLEGVGGGVFVGVELGGEGAVALFQRGGV